MIYISSLCSMKKRIGDSVDEIAQLGFKNIELTGGTEFYNDIEGDLFYLKRKYRLNFLIHNYFPPQIDDFVLNPASVDYRIKKSNLSLIRQAVELAKKLGENLYSIHPGFRNNLIPELEDRLFVKQGGKLNRREDFYQMIDLMLDEVVGGDFRIAVENLSPRNSVDKYSFLSDREDIEQFLSYFHNRANLGILLDLGHLDVASRLLNFDRDKLLDILFTKYRNKIFELHLSENDSRVDSHGISRANSWQIECVYKNRDILSGIPIVFEWHNAASSLAYERFKMLADKLMRG